MVPDLNGRIFTTEQNTANGEVNNETTFTYHQTDRLVWAEYSGGLVVSGHLIGVIADDGTLDMRYHHVNASGEVLAGTCTTTITTDPDGRVVLEESWQWLTGDRSSGTSRVVELSPRSPE